MFITAYPSRRYRSPLVGIALHSGQSVIFTAPVLAVVLRWAFPPTGTGCPERVPA